MKQVWHEVLLCIPTHCMTDEVDDSNRDMLSRILKNVDKKYKTNTHCPQDYKSGLNMSSIATSVVLNPSQPEKNFLMMWIARRVLCSTPRLSFFVNNCSLLVLDIDINSDMLQETMVNLRDHSRHLITGLFISPHGLSLLDNMSTLAQDKSPWRLDSECSKPHIPGVPGQCPPDTKESILKLLTSFMGHNQAFAIMQKYQANGGWRYGCLDKGSCIRRYNPNSAS